MPDGTTRVALINFADNDDWVLHDGYYYYKGKVEAGKQTDILFECAKVPIDIDEKTLDKFNSIPN